MMEKILFPADLLYYELATVMGEVFWYIQWCHAAMEVISSNVAVV